MTIRGVLNIRRDDLNSGQSNGWMLVVPFSSKLISVACTEHFVFDNLTADELRPYRETVGGKSTRQAQSRHAAEVEGFEKTSVITRRYYSSASISNGFADVLRAVFDIVGKSQW